MDVNKKIFECGVVPVIKLNEASEATPLCRALYDGGIFVAEITFRSDAAEESIRRVAAELPEVLVGAGTVLNVENAKKAEAAGAKFVVTPGINRPVIEYCLERNLPIFSGCSGPSDLEILLSYGLEIAKFFPSESLGGLKTIKAISAPYSMFKFMPTGGIDATLIGEYMKFNKILACGGSWMVKDDLVKEKRFDEITRLTREAVLKMHGFTFAHMGVNPEDGQSADSVADMYRKAFGFEPDAGNSSIFTAGRMIELMRTGNLGRCGHIGIRVNNVARAMAYMERLGFELDRTTLRGSESAPTFVCLKESFGSFAVHLVQ